MQKLGDWLMAVIVFALLAAACAAGQPTPLAAPTANPVPTQEPSTTPEPRPTPVPTIEASVVPAPKPTPGPTPSSTPEPTPEPVLLSVAVAASSLEPVDCPAGAVSPQISCSVATLPLDAANPSPAQVVKLMVALVDNGDPNGTGPVVFLQGGPGVGSVDRASNFVGGAHDVLFVDQRGTGLSEPKLSCPELSATWQDRHTDDDATRLSDEDEIVALYATCEDRLRSEGIDFAFFNTRAAAIDIELLRQLYGYDEWSLWGISYGTRLGLTIMRDHPDGVRAAVLDSIVPLEVDFFATIPEHGWRAIQALDQACDSTRCAASHGDFVTNLSELVQQLNDEPIAVIATRAETGEQFDFRVDGTQLLDMVFSQLYSTRSLRSLPRQVSRAEFGGLQEMVTNYVSRRDPNSFDLAIGLYYTTWCREEFPFHDPGADDALLAELEPIFDGAVESSFSSDGVEDLCDLFAVPTSDPIDNEPVVSDIPTLVFAGAFDPITPPAWSLQVAESMTNATFVQMADHGHGMSTSCPARLRVAFLTDPGATLDTTCAEETGGPAFD